MLPVEQPFKAYTGLDGKPLNNGFVYFGQPNQDPITHPVTVYWDAAGTLPAAQPLRTVNGYVVNDSGSAANPFFSGSYSTSVLDSKGRQVFYAQSSANFSTASVVSQFLSDASGSGGSSLIGFIQPGSGAKKRTLQDKAREVFSTKDTGAVADGNADDTPAFDAARDNAATHIDVPTGTYKVNVCHFKPNAVYRGIGNPAVAFNYVSGGAIAWLAFQSNSRYDGIAFQSNEPNLENQRGAIEDVSNVTIRDCSFKGFRHASAAPNAWGLHIARSTGILIENTEFGNNSQSDIALTDTVRDITIINAFNTTDNGVKLNIEPNTQDGVDGMNVIGGHFREVDLLENDNRGYAGRNILISGARVDLLVYDGSGATLSRCKVGAVTNSPDTTGATYAGALMIDTCDLGPNLLTDPYLFDVSTSPDSFWGIYATGSAPYCTRISDANGKYIRVNPNKNNADYYPTPNQNIAVVAGEVLFFFLRARCDNRSIPGVFPTPSFVQWKNSSNATISTTTIKSCRGPFSSFTDWTNDIAVLIPPSGATSAKLYVGATGAVSVDIMSTGLFRPTMRTSGMGNMPEVIGRLSRPNLEREFYRPTAPSGAQQWPGYFVGERVINSTPASGQPRAWTCTVAGAPGTWASEGNLP